MNTRPEMLAQADPVDNKLYPHNAFINDGVLPYIDWATSQGYGVIDINIPFHISSGSESPRLLPPKPSESVLQTQTKDLLCYLWDNYLSLLPSSSLLLLMGVGDSYLGIKSLLTSRSSRSRIAGILCFVSGSLRPIKSETDPGLSSWYKEHSRIYVSPDHAVWSDEEAARKVRKNRYGKVVMSEVEGVRNMLDEYVREGTEWLGERMGERMDPDETEDEGEDVDGRLIV